MSAIFKTLLAIFVAFSFITVQSGEAPSDRRLYQVDHLSEQYMATAISSIYKIDTREAKLLVSYVNYFSEEFDINPLLMFGLIGVESGFKRTATSPTGKGYTQVYEKYHRNKIRQRDIFKTSVNIEVGMTILKECKKKNKNRQKSLACYNGALTPEKAASYYQKVMRQKDRIHAEVLRVLLT